MHLFIFDFSGTLAALKDPARYVLDLKQKHPAAKVVLYTGMDHNEIRRECPGLLDAVDEMWQKPLIITTKMGGLDIDRLIVVDDDPDMKFALKRLLRKSTIPQIDLLDPSALPGLLTE